MNPIEPPKKKLSLTKVTLIFIGIYVILIILYLLAAAFIVWS